MIGDWRAGSWRSICGFPLQCARVMLRYAGWTRRQLSANYAILSNCLLKPGEADRILAGHPWVYHGSVLRLTQPAADGELIQLKDHREPFLGVGFYNSRSKINVRSGELRRRNRLVLI